MTFLAVAKDIRDIKGPLYFPVNYTPLIIILCALFLTGIFFLFRFTIKRIKKKKKEAIAKIRLPHEIAYEALEALKAKGLPLQGKIKEYYYELSLIARHYIEDRFDIKAPDMTTEEFLFDLKDSGSLSKAHKDILKEFLNLCDTVKFAKYGPTQKETEDSFNAAGKLVDETKQAEEE
ncbi:MAG: hypothetical protein ISS26_04380 [Candidatus Omnitrophica bacterium]|nr:hypothetical protein [Candidatus Omnitrophota bacterium]